MAVRPEIALQYHPAVLPDSPTDALQRNVSIMDMVSQLHQRQQQAKEYEAQAPVRAAANLTALQGAAEETAMKKAWTAAQKPYDPNVGDIEFDDAQAQQVFDSTDIPGIGKGSYLMSQYQAGKAAQLATHRKQALDELDSHNAMVARQATPIENFLALEPDKRQSAYPALKAALLPTDPGWGKLLGNQYSPALHDPIFQKIVDMRTQALDAHAQLSEAKDREEMKSLTAEGMEQQIAERLQTIGKAKGLTPDKIPQEDIESVLQSVIPGYKAKPPISQTVQASLRKQGLRLNAEGVEEPIPLAELSPREQADLERTNLLNDLTEAQKAATNARAELDKLRADPDSPQYKQAQARLDIYQQNADTAASRLGISAANLDVRQAGFERDTYSQYARIRPVLDSVSELADKINTGEGLVAKATGEAQKLAAKTNYDDDVAEYQSLVQAFTPLWARALGHTGVLTQQDVDSAREALPKPGDSVTLKDRKLARIETILAGVVKAQESVAGHPGEIKTPAKKISVKAPDGSVHEFDTQAQADTFKKLAGIQ